MDDCTLIKKVFERDIGEEIIEIYSCRNAVFNINNVFRVDAANKSYIFKLYRKKGYPEDGKIPFIAGKLTEHNIPHAKICSYNRNDNDFPNGYVIEEYLPGVTADRLGLDNNAWCGFYKNLALMVSKVHQIMFDKHGFIINVVPDCNTLTEHIESNFVYGKHSVYDIYTSNEIESVQRSLINSLKPCDNIQPCLCHIDIQPKNVIVHNGGATLIDWDDARSFPAIVDIARLTLLIELDFDNENSAEKQRSEMLKSAFLNNYGNAETIMAYHKHETALHVWHGLILLNFCKPNTPQFHKIKTSTDAKLRLLT